MNRNSYHRKITVKEASRFENKKRKTFDEECF